MKLEPEYLNSAIMKKLDVMIQDGIGPVLMRMLKDRLGASFQAKFDEHLEKSRAPKVNWLNDKPLWDFNGIMHGITFYGQLRNNQSGREEGKLAQKLRRIRNDISHTSFDEIASHASFERTSDFLRTAQTLFEAFGASAQNREVRSLIVDYDAHRKEAQAEAASHKDRPVEQNPEAARQPEPTTQPKPDVPPQEPNSASEAKAPPKEAEVFESRSTPLPKPGAGSVWFPTVGDGVNDDFGYFLASRMVEPQPNASAFIFGLPDAKKAEVQRVINEVRASEEHDLSAWTTRLRSDGMFVGQSFGVAAALADRTARYGLAASLEGVTIVATGSIISLRRGKVGVIDSLMAKMSLLETSPESRDLGKILFIFPQGNLDVADPETRAVLTRWKSEGSRIAWRAISHIDELNDILGPGEGRANVGSNAAIPDVPEMQSANKPEIPGDGVRPPSNGETSSEGPRSFLIKGILFGLFVVVSLIGGAIWLEKTRIDPALLQASDQRIQRLVAAADTARQSDHDASLCTRVGSAADAITDFDRPRMLDEAKSAASYWQNCHQQFTASDGRIAELVRLAVNSNAGNSDIAALARATNAISPFDIARPLSPSAKNALSIGGEAVAKVEASKNRLSAFSDAWSQFQSDHDSFEPQVQTAVRSLTPDDEKLADPALTNSISEATKYFARKDQGAREVAALGLSARAYQTKPDYQSAKTFVSAYDDLNAADQSSLLATLPAASPDDGIAKARQQLADSAKRLNALLSFYNATNAGETNGTVRLATLVSLQQAAQSITDFDRTGMTDDHYAAIKKANEVPGLLADSDRRISVAIKNAMNAQIRSFKVNMSLLTDIQDSIGFLRPLDIDRLDPSARKLLAAACNSAPAIAPGQVFPEINLTCSRL